MINVVWLKTFCMLVEVGHFTQTAQKLCMTQSGVSQHIAKLEAQLGVLLLHRSGKQFSITEAGTRLYAQGNSILASLSAIEQDVVEDPFDEGVVRIMSPGSVGLQLYSKLLDVQSAHPKLCIDYRFAPNKDIQRALCESQIDLGFMSIRPDAGEVAYELIAHEPLLLVTPANVKNLSWQILSTLGFIDHPDGAHHAGLLLSANFEQFQHSDLLIKKGFSNQIGMILEPVSKGFGFSVLPAHAVAAFDKPIAIRVHQLPVEVTEPIYVCTQRKPSVPSRVKHVKDEALKWLKASM